MTAVLVATLAAGLPSTTSAYLERMDADGDHRVDVGEYQRYMSVGFKRMDANGDGVVDASERPPSPRQRPPMTRARHQHNLADTFQRQDRNGDGYLDARELMAPPG